MAQFVREIKVRSAELSDQLSVAPWAFLMRSGAETYCGAFADRISNELDPSRTVVTENCAIVDEFDLPHWVGGLPYEAFRGMERRGGLAIDQRIAPDWLRPLWRRYPAVARVLDDVAWVVGETESSVERLAQLLVAQVRPSSLPQLSWSRAPEAAALHRERINRALDFVARGELYQVNLARRFDFKSETQALPLYSALAKAAPAPYGLALNWGNHSVVSLSPELFLAVSPTGRVLTRPIKGTRPRSLDPQLDARLRLELDSSEKEQAELAMVVDIERNDLGRVARPGSVRMCKPPHVVEYPTVLHREAEVEASLETGTSFHQLLEVMCPSGSVTGAPKVSAMDLIAELEAERRGLYTGALGFITRSGHLQLSMAIRTLCLSGGEAQYFVGGGIVADSDPQQELEETLWKAEQLSALVELGVALN